ncbi:shikimate kinase [Hydrogenimonas cancrithermarum]|uniref:Shikimate kinase n=1 Tax=Hydrogenimonas cancrithermarum TaxID=2993563 RepID=A0ABN6WXS0_9BACT|nr:shikimate kinase [Hydrogenimonas cancrithermarum]BDY13858.1 shikimate kinase [Hydrogenimonas cancrithermarum]
MGKRNIVLIGFMGVGKGALAREIVRHEPALYALDTDDMIESLTNTKIKKIFATAGEAAFRALEQKTADWLAENVTNAVISTGGGFYKVDNLKAIGTVVYLQADFNWIVERILGAHNAKKKLKKRPLFQDLEKAKKLFDERYEAYEKVADIVVDVSKGDLETIAEELLKEVR